MAGHRIYHPYIYIMKISLFLHLLPHFLTCHIELVYKTNDYS
uniref:Uncharacterized protein n=1 Tax=Arundo donax TaxID=35708 RepID=A0A0A8YW88_ARUDO